MADGLEPEKGLEASNGSLGLVLGERRNRCFLGSRGSFIRRGRVLGGGWGHGGIDDSAGKGARCFGSNRNEYLDECVGGREGVVARCFVVDIFCDVFIRSFQLFAPVRRCVINDTPGEVGCWFRLTFL